MGTALVIYLFLATHLYAGSSTSSTSSTTTTDVSLPDSTLSAAPTTRSSAPFDEDAELAKIAQTCLSSRDYEEITGYIVKSFVARMLSVFLLDQSVPTIGLTELRAALDLAPMGPWQPYNGTKPSEDELASASTIQAYYDLKEPRSRMRSLDSEHMYEQDLAASIAYLDKRFPSIRTIFRRRFEEIRRSDSGAVDKKAVDRMIDEFKKIHYTVIRAVSRMRRNED